MMMDLEELCADDLSLKITDKQHLDFDQYDLFLESAKDYAYLKNKYDRFDSSNLSREELDKFYSVKFNIVNTARWYDQELTGFLDILTSRIDDSNNLSFLRTSLSYCSGVERIYSFVDVSDSLKKKLDSVNNFCNARITDPDRKESFLEWTFDAYKKGWF